MTLLLERTSSAKQEFTIHVAETMEVQKKTTCTVGELAMNGTQLTGQTLRGRFAESKIWSPHLQLSLKGSNLPENGCKVKNHCHRRKHSDWIFSIHIEWVTCRSNLTKLLNSAGELLETLFTGIRGI